MKKNLGVKIFAILILLAGGFFIYMSFEEFYITGVYKKNNGAYPFGCVNECLWYYKDAKTYSLYNLFCGLAILIPYLFLLYFLFRFSFKAIVIASFFIIIEIMVVIPIIQQIPNY